MAALKFKVVDRLGNGIEVTDRVTRPMRVLANEFPREFVRAVQNTAFVLRRILHKGISAGSVDGRVIPKTKPLQKQARERLLQKNPSNKVLRKHIRTLRRFKGGDKNQNLLRALRYKKLPDGAMFGWLGRAGASKAKAVQAGARGADRVFQFLRAQPVTGSGRKGSKKGGQSGMRGYLFKIGIGVKKSTKIIRQPSADVIEPFYRSRLRFILRSTEARLRHNVEKTVAKKTGVRKAVA